MCGFVGIASKVPLQNVEQLLTMRDTMIHRGPDDAGVFLSQDGRIGLAHRRLAIIDLSPGGHHGRLVGNPRVVVDTRPGLDEPELSVADEPLTSRVPVEQRVKNLLRLDGDNGSMMVEALRGLGAGDDGSHTVEAWIRPHRAPAVRSWPLLLGTPGLGGASHGWLLDSKEEAR